METGSIGPDINKSALIIVDMQNDFLHREGNFSHIAREHPEANIDMPFLIGTIPNVKDWLMRSEQREGQSCILRTC
jgi:nicotinamidase-related amidase